MSDYKLIPESLYWVTGYYDGILAGYATFKGKLGYFKNVIEMYDETADRCVLYSVMYLSDESIKHVEQRKGEADYAIKADTWKEYVALYGQFYAHENDNKAGYFLESDVWAMEWWRK